MNAAMVEALHDTRWLGLRHRSLLMADLLDLPDQGNHFGYGGHPAVLMSIPDEICGTETAWIDIEIAELVWLLNKHYGLTTIEACQGNPGDENGVYDWAFLAFERRRYCQEFMALAGDALRGELREHWGRNIRFPYSQLAGITRAAGDCQVTP